MRFPFLGILLNTPSMKSNPALFAISFVLVLIFAGCASGPDIDSQRNLDIDVSDYDSFALIIPQDFVEGGKPGASLKHLKTVEEGLRNALAAKGYTETSRENADFGVVVKAKIVPQTKVEDYGYDMIPGPYYRGYYPYNYGMSGVDVYQYDEGTLIIEIFDAELRQLAWVGWATDRISGKDNPELLKTVIGEILADFPDNA